MNDTNESKENYMRFLEMDVNSFIKNLTFCFVNFQRTCIDYFLSCVKSSQQNLSTFEAKVIFYHKCWETTVKYLYITLPEIYQRKNIYDGEFELTPFSILMTDFDLTDWLSILKLSKEDQEYCLNVCKRIEKRIRYTKSIYGDSLSQVLIPDEENKRISFAVCILLTPPLSALGDYYFRAYRYHSERLRDVLETVQNLNVRLPEWKENLGLHFSSRFLTQEDYDSFGGMEGIISDPSFIAIKGELEKVKAECEESITLSKTAICPYCGHPHKVSVDRNSIFFAHLNYQHNSLASYIMLTRMNEYREHFLQEFVRISNQDVSAFNSDDPNCYILVEGATEEFAIPYLAVKYGKPLILGNIKVWNSQTKQKVLMDFEKLMKNDPEKCVIALLDGDADTEFKELERKTQNRHDKYSVYKIPGNGEFEDLFDIDILVKGLDKLYGDGVFKVEDFDNDKTNVSYKSFVKQTEKLIAGKPEYPKLDKVKFIQKVTALIDRKHIPQLVIDIIEDAYIRGQMNG